MHIALTNSRAFHIVRTSMDDFASDTDSDYTSYWRDWVSECSFPSAFQHTWTSTDICTASFLHTCPVAVFHTASVLVAYLRSGTAIPRRCSSFSHPEHTMKPRRIGFILGTSSPSESSSSFTLHWRHHVLMMLLLMVVLYNSSYKSLTTIFSLYLLAAMNTSARSTKTT